MIFIDMYPLEKQIENPDKFHDRPKYHERPILPNYQIHTILILSFPTYSTT